MSNTIRLGLIAPAPNDATSFVRSFGCFPYLAKHHQLTIAKGTVWGWEDLVGLDCVFLQRPWTQAHVSVAECAKDLGIPVWCDWDDNLFALHPSNPGYSEFMRDSVHQRIWKLVALSDVITASTQHLADALSKRAHVIPNAFNDYVWEFGEIEPAEKVITWRGGLSHFADIEPFLPTIKRIATDLPDYTFHFVGDPHWGIRDAIPSDRLVLHPWSSLLSYMELLKSLKPRCHIVPLIDHPFNRSKSNLAWIEASYAGAVVVAPNLPEWERPGILRYETDAELYHRARLACGCSEQERAALVGDSRKHISQHLMLSTVNEQRFSILRKLCV